MAPLSLPLFIGGGIHGLDERVLVEGFHGQVPIWVDLVRRLASN